VVLQWRACALVLGSSGLPLLCVCAAVSCRPHDARTHNSHSCVPIVPPYPVLRAFRLYFKSLSWLRLLFVWLALGSVPFLVVINSSKFTSPTLSIHGNDTAAAWDAPEAGVKVYTNVSPGYAWVAEHRQASRAEPKADPLVSGRKSLWLQRQQLTVNVRVLVCKLNGTQPQQVTLSSFTFAAIPDSRRDGGALSWMNIRLPGSKKIGGLWKNDFLMCEFPLQALNSEGVTAPTELVSC
jgi:hypothetical protein